MWREDLAGRPDLRDKAREKQGAACPRPGSKLAEKKKGCEGREANSPIAKGVCVTLPSWDKATPKKVIR